eukprot:GHVP01053907.1.p1 GENE.GHVP01053907.1~~GHVP01053907.1.p1  ORF type:complete len:360 (+),score=49.72 GHVP01053907.1:28-1107(+)
MDQNPDSFIMRGYPQQSAPGLPLMDEKAISVASGFLAEALSPEGQNGQETTRLKYICGLVLRLVQFPVDSNDIILELIGFRREDTPELAPVLWHCPGAITALLQEIVCSYTLLSPPKMDKGIGNRVCNVIALLQSVASHPATKQHFLRAQLPLYMYPFLNTVSKTRHFEYLRLTSLGLIGALVKQDDPAVISYLLQTEIIPLCLRNIDMGSTLSKTVATFIVSKVLSDLEGLNYVCQAQERFLAVIDVFSSVLNNISKMLLSVEATFEGNPQDDVKKLLKHVVKCYTKLAGNVYALEYLRKNCPESVKNYSIHFEKLLNDQPLELLFQTLNRCLFTNETSSDSVRSNSAISPAGEEDST